MGSVIQRTFCFLSGFGLRKELGHKVKEKRTKKTQNETCQKFLFPVFLLSRHLNSAKPESLQQTTFETLELLSRFVLQFRTLFSWESVFSWCFFCLLDRHVQQKSLWERKQALETEI